MKRKQLHLRIEEDLHSRFMGVCKDQAVNPSELVRKWIREWVEKEECRE